MSDHIKQTLQQLEPRDLPAVLLFTRFVNWKAGRKANLFEIIGGGFLYYSFRIAQIMKAE